MPKLRLDDLRLIQSHERTGVYVSAISPLEIVQSVKRGSMDLPMSPREWPERALAYPGVRLVPLNAAITSDAYSFPEPFHKDPADRLIVATARILNVPLLTADEKILAYPHVPLAR